MSNARLDNQPMPLRASKLDGGAPLPQPLSAVVDFDTCTIANAIEGLGVRLSNQAYTHPRLVCVTDDFPRLLGYAATCRVRSSDPPMTGVAYLERTDWWSAIEHLPIPRVAVIQDPDAARGPAPCEGEVHAAILKAFGCEGVITDGAVRYIPGVRESHFPMFARSVAASYSYFHLVDYGQWVKFFGLEIRSGDLLYADCHPVGSIPHENVPELPAAAAKIRKHEQRIIDICRSPAFSPEKLLKVIQRGD